MSRKRKYIKDYHHQIISMESEEEMVDNVNAVNEDVTSTQQDDSKNILYYDIFPSDEKIMSNINNNDDNTNEDEICNTNDLNNISYNELLFLNTDFFQQEYVLSESDILNSFSENVILDDTLNFCDNVENEVHRDTSVSNQISSTNLLNQNTNTVISSSDTSVIKDQHFWKIPNFTVQNAQRPSILSNFSNNEGVTNNDVPVIINNANNDTIDDYIEHGEVLDDNFILNNVPNDTISNFETEYLEILNCNQRNCSDTNIGTNNNNLKMVSTSDTNVTDIKDNFSNFFENTQINSPSNVKSVSLEFLKQKQSIHKNKINIKKAVPCAINLNNINSLKINTKDKVKFFKFSLIGKEKLQELKENKEKVGTKFLGLQNNLKSKNNVNKISLVNLEDYIKIIGDKHNKIPVNQTVVKLCDDKSDKCAQVNNKCTVVPDINDNVKLQSNSNIVVNSDNNYESSKCSEQSCVVLDRIKKLQLKGNNLSFKISHWRSAKLLLSNHSLTHEDFVDNNDKVSYYTGIPEYSYFMALLNCLNLPKNSFITPFQMLLLTLMKIRLNLDWMDLAFRFNRNEIIIKDAFGITISIMSRCLSHIFFWPIQEKDTKVKYSTRSNITLYIYGIKLKSENCDAECDNKKKSIFICLSALEHPIHFISKPLAGEHNRVNLLVKSGIISGLVCKDVIMFDKNTYYSSLQEDKSKLLKVSTQLCDSFFMINRDDKVQYDLTKINCTISKINKFKFLNDSITCEWENSPVSNNNIEYVLFCDIVKVVCGLINLCDILPFTNNAIKNIMSERKTMNILLR